MPGLPLNVYALVRERIVEALDALAREGALPEGLDLRHVEVSPPREAAHGDLACNAAMVLAKPAKMKPRDIADALAAKLQRRCGYREGRGGGTGLPQHDVRAGLLASRGDGDPGDGRRLRPRQPRQKRTR